MKNNKIRAYVDPLDNVWVSASTMVLSMAAFVTGIAMLLFITGAPSTEGKDPAWLFLLAPWVLLGVQGFLYSNNMATGLNEAQKHLLVEYLNCPEPMRKAMPLTREDIRSLDYSEVKSLEAQIVKGRSDFNETSNRNIITTKQHLEIIGDIADDVRERELEFRERYKALG